MVRGSQEYLYSMEGVTQGDPLSMFLYAIGTLPLIRSLKTDCSCTQIWYADDASACGSLFDLHHWFELLLSQGPDFGYVANPAKCCVVVNDSFKVDAEHLFSSLGVPVVCNHRYLGGFIGEPAGQTAFVQDKVHQWIAPVQSYSKIAGKQPQAAFSALTKSLQCEWQFLQRVVSDCGDLFAPLDDVLTSTFLPAVFGCEVTPLERLLFSLPVRFGGLGVYRPQCTAEFSFTASRNATQVIVQALHGVRCFEVDRHEETVLCAHKDFVRQSELRNDELFTNLLSRFDGVRRRSVERAKMNSLSGWLTVLPIGRDHFDLTAQEFRDALALRYRKPLQNVPPRCDGCGAPFSLDHALICKKGGLIIQRHNEVRDAIGDLAALVCGRVVSEPVVRDASENSEALIADLGVRGVWQPQTMALFDIRVIDTDARSYLSHSPGSVLASAEADKKRKYCDACTERRATFTPLCFSVDGLAGDEATCFLKHLANSLSVAWERSYSDVIRWLRARLAFALVRATDVCVRGSRTQWRSLGLEDGAAVSFD